MKPIILVVLLIAALCLAARCHPQPSPGPDAGPAPGTGGGPADAGLDAATGGFTFDAAPPGPQADCAAAGAKLKALQCRDGDGAPLWQGPTGVPYADDCWREYQRGYDQHAACVATISSCDQADSAFRGFLCLDGGQS
jgi:hypothetical protein